MCPRPRAHPAPTRPDHAPVQKRFPTHKETPMKRKNKARSASPVSQCKSKGRFRPVMELLEDRVLLSVTPALDIANRKLSFIGDGDVYLRTSNNQLQYSVDGSNYNADLDFLAPGMQTL